MQADPRAMTGPAGLPYLVSPFALQMDEGHDSVADEASGEPLATQTLTSGPVFAALASIMNTLSGQMPDIWQISTPPAWLDKVMMSPEDAARFLLAFKFAHNACFLAPLLLTAMHVRDHPSPSEHLL
eukprot:360838-Chlamydomonas_euryale.AAC.6